MAIKIPFAKPFYSELERKYLLEAYDSGWISTGQFVKRFEENFNKYLQSPFGLTTSNGTTALQLALLALDIGPGDEVIVPDFCFVAPVNMVIAVGATPVFADIDPDTWCIDVKSVQQCVSAKTKAIIAVHNYGNVCNLTDLMDTARKNKLLVIEDTAEAAFSKYDNRYAGTIADIGCFSFHAAKTLSTGEGGYVVTGNRKFYERMCLLRDQGMNPSRRYWHEEVGYNFRITNLQAAIGCAQLEKIDTIIQGRQRIYGTYKKHLKNIDGIRLQKIPANVDPVFWSLAVCLNPDHFKLTRDALIKALLDAGIETRPGFYPFHVMPPYQTAPKKTNSIRISPNILVLPFFCDLKDEDIAYICRTLETHSIKMSSMHTHGHMK